MAKRTDLAAEAHELWQEGAADRKLEGVRVQNRRVLGCPVTTVQITDREAAQALGKPEGVYVTLEVDPAQRRAPGGFERACRVLAKLLEPMLPPQGCILVAGLGNASITPDALGPLCAQSLCVTRHLTLDGKDEWEGLRPVACVTPGVLGNTGMESLELVKGAAAHTRCSCVIVVDALASRRMDRICAGIQLSNTGLTPGSGVGNHRAGFDRESLGVPVIAVGVPTVVDAATLTLDVLDESGYAGVDAQTLAGKSGSMIVTPRDIDESVRELARLLGCGITMACQPGWSLADAEMFVR